MVWEVRAGVVVVLGQKEKGEDNFWPPEGGHQLHPVVIGGQWEQDALYINTYKMANSSNLKDLTEASIQIHCYEDNTTEYVTLLHYPSWPQNGK